MELEEQRIIWRHLLFEIYSFPMSFESFDRISEQFWVDFRKIVYFVKYRKLFFLSEPDGGGTEKWLKRKNSSELNVSERDLTPVKISSKNIEKQES